MDLGWNHRGRRPALPMGLDPQLAQECDYFSRTMNRGVHLHKEAFMVHDVLGEESQVYYSIAKETLSRSSTTNSTLTSNHMSGTLEISQSESVPKKGQNVK